MRRPKQWPLAFLGAAVGASGLACGAILGVDDVAFRAPLDAQTGEDAGAETASRSDADAGAANDAIADTLLCTGAEHWICDTFDRDGAIDDPSYWSEPLVVGGIDASVSFAAGPNLSPPNALAFEVDNATAILASSTFGPPATGVRCHLGFYIERRCQQNPAKVFQLLLTGSAMTYEFFILLNKAGSTLDEWHEAATPADGGVTTVGQGSLRDLLPLKKFTQIEVDVSATSLSITYDGQSEATGHVVSVPPGSFTTTRATIGIAPISVEQGCAVRFDDVVCDRY